MLKVAITGNIAAGKSTVENFLKENGFKVLDTDHIGHTILDNNNAVIDAFKDFDILDNGNISRTKLGIVVFNHPEKLELLNSILHPQIREKIEEFFNNNKSENTVYVSIPLLFEANMQDMFDKIIFVYADDEIRMQRLIKRNGYSNEYAQKRILSQLPQEDKLNKCDIIINNNGTLEDLQKQMTLCL